jgi:hypothetical protein
VIAHWRDRIDRLIRELPDLRGIVMAGAGGDWVRGPWECQCSKCRRHTDRELLVRAMAMIGEPWAQAGGRIIWKAVTDRPTLVGTEVEHFANLDGELRPTCGSRTRRSTRTSAAASVPADLLRPCRSGGTPIPLGKGDQSFPSTPTSDADQGSVRPYLCGSRSTVSTAGRRASCVMIDRWGEVMAADAGLRGAMGICSFRSTDRWDHPLNMANWYVGPVCVEPGRIAGSDLSRLGELTLVRRQPTR